MIVNSGNMTYIFHFFAIKICHYLEIEEQKDKVIISSN